MHSILTYIRVIFDMRFLIFINLGNVFAREKMSSILTKIISALLVTSPAECASFGRLNFSQSWLSTASQKMAKGLPG